MNHRASRAKRHAGGSPLERGVRRHFRQRLKRDVAHALARAARPWAKLPDFNGTLYRFTRRLDAEDCCVP